MVKNRSKNIKKAETIIGKISALQADAPNSGSELQEAARLIRKFIEKQ